jgi:hypothetical protein
VHELTRDRPHLAGRLPGRDIATAGSCRALGDQQRDQDDDEKDRVVARPVSGLERHRLVDHADADRRDGDRREPLHAADDRRGQGLEQEARAEHLADRQADHSGSQEHGHVRQDARDDPDDRVQLPDRDAEGQRAVTPFGGAADRDPEVGVPHEQAKCDEADRHDDGGQEIGGVEGHARQAEAGLERRVEAGRDEEVAEQGREEERSTGEHLSHTDLRRSRSGGVTYGG